MITGRFNRFGIATITGLALGALIAGCTGSTGGGEDEDSGGGFVAGPDTIGTIDLDVNETNLSVGDVTGFRVHVRNAAGAPVENIQVSCDTEEGLAIVEPTSGTELTDSNGQMSGKVGCEDPGSLMIGCRLPIGAGLRQFVTIICEGDRPGGFTGFPGASGGGIGNGTGGVGDDGDPDGNTLDSVAVLDIAFRNAANGENSPDIDIDQIADCDDQTAGNQPEPFGNHYIDFKVKNGSSSTVTVESYSYVVTNVTTNVVAARSSTIEVTGSNFDIDPDGEGDFSGIFLNAAAGASSDKSYIAAGNPSVVAGTYSITLTFNMNSGDPDIGSFRVSRTVTVDLDSFDEC